MLSQLMMLFGFFSLVLILVYWINQAVRLFDQLIADGQSAFVFLEFTALSLPGVIRLALPLAAFAAAVYVTNRMSSDSEIVAVKATGFSAWRIARPVAIFGLIVAAIMSVLMHVLVPLSTAQLDDRKREIARSLSARLLTEGQFTEPVPGLTLYIREITQAGELRDIFLADTTDPEREITYTASLAYLTQAAESAQLVMVDGMAQTLDRETNRLFVTSFDDFAYDIGAYLATGGNEGRRAREVPTTELLSPDAALLAETGDTRAELITEGHDRIGQSLLGAVAALLGYAALMVGGYSRFGVWRQVVVAIFLIIVVKGMETAGLDLARRNPDLWWAAYLSVATGLVIVAALLVLSERPRILPRRRGSQAT